jgi:hypothetical protein
VGATQASTLSPTRRLKTRCDSATTAITPSPVPGSRPSIAQPIPGQSADRPSRITASTACPDVSKINGTGTSMGSTNASNGAATSAIPYPTAPCTSALKAITRPAAMIIGSLVR